MNESHVKPPKKEAAGKSFLTFWTISDINIPDDPHKINFWSEQDPKFFRPNPLFYLCRMRKKKRLEKHKAWKFLIYSRFLAATILLFLQLAYYVYLCLRLSPYGSYLVGLNAVVSVLFIAYLVNSSQKSEFKLVWLIPALVFPIFGISMYVLTRVNYGKRKIRKKLAIAKEITNKFTEKIGRGTDVEKTFPEIRDIAAYAKNAECFPCFAGGKTTYFPSGEAAFPEMVSALKKAERFIFLDYFIIQIGVFWNEIFEILAERAKKGVQIRVLFDGIGSVGLASKRFRRTLESAGIEAREFMPMVPVFDMGLNNRDHHKIMDIDGKICFTGGVNLTDEYINREHRRFAYWKDGVIRIEGDAVSSFTKIFLQIWHSHDKKISELETDAEKFLNVENRTSNAAGAVIPYADDGYNSQDLAENVYHYILGRSQKYTHIMSPYLVLDDGFLNALVFAAGRGVDVKIVIPGHYDHYITYCIGLRFAKTLLQNGVRVYLYKPGFLHSKIFSADDSMATVGSVNLDYRSFYYHFECGAFLFKTDSIRDIENDFQKTLARSVELSLDNYNSHVSRTRRLVGWLCKILSPLV